MAPDCPEGDFEDALIDMATSFGWMAHCERPAHVLTDEPKPRYKTPIKGHPGYPDVTAVHTIHGVVFAELKSAHGRLRTGQADWLRKMAAHDHPGSLILVELWKPADWDAIEVCFRYGLDAYRRAHRRPPPPIYSPT